jgi:hypothetical protein
MCLTLVKIETPEFLTYEIPVVFARIFNKMQYCVNLFLFSLNNLR